MERKARSLRIMCQLSLGKVSSAPNGTTGSFSMKSLICWNSPQCNGEGSNGGGGVEVQRGQVMRLGETGHKEGIEMNDGGRAASLNYAHAGAEWWHKHTHVSVISITLESLKRIHGPA